MSSGLWGLEHLESLAERCVGELRILDGDRALGLLGARVAARDEHLNEAPASALILVEQLDGTRPLGLVRTVLAEAVTDVALEDIFAPALE